MNNQEIRLVNIDGKSIILNEFQLPDLGDKLKDIIMVDSLGITADKIVESNQKIMAIVNTEEMLVRVISFSNINGMSNQMTSVKYEQEVRIVKELSAQRLKQSFLRIYWNEFKTINELQIKANLTNFYSKKAKKLNYDGDFTNMHFAFDFDSRIMKEVKYIRLKKDIVSKLRE
jgi:hypothetical protein